MQSGTNSFSSKFLKSFKVGRALNRVSVDCGVVAYIVEISNRLATLVASTVLKQVSRDGKNGFLSTD